MKKVLAAAFVVALMAVTITGASADPAERLTANAYSVNLGGSLLPGLLDREGDNTATLPPGNEGQDDILTADLSAVFAGAGTTQAQARRDATIDDDIVLRRAGFVGGDGGAAEGSGGLLGILGGGGSGNGIVGGILNGVGGGGGLAGGLLNSGGGGGLAGGLLNGATGSLGASSTGDGGTVEAQQLGGIPIGGGGSGDILGLLIGPDGILGSALGGGTTSGVLDENIDAPAANGRGFASIAIAGLLTGGTGGGAGIPLISQSEGEGSFGVSQIGGILPGTTAGVLTNLVFDALLRLGLIEAEATVTCAGGLPVYDVASRIAESRGSSLDLGETLNSTLGTLLTTVGGIAPSLIDIKQNETGALPGGGRFVNALRVTVGGAIDETVPVGLPIVGGILPTLPGLGVGAAGDEPLIDLVLGHAEVDGSICTAAAAPPAIQQPTGDAGPSLPRTGGGLGLLPAVLTLGLLGAAVTGGRVALRSRRSANSSSASL